MKDKLVRNHRKGYYKVRRFFIGAFFFCSGIALISVPTYIAIINYDAETSLATSEEEVPEEQDDSGDNLITIYQEY